MADPPSPNRANTPVEQEERMRRDAAALRSNLLRRKAQSRAKQDRDAGPHSAGIPSAQAT